MDCSCWTASTHACVSLGKPLATLAPIEIIPVILDGDLVPLKGVPALLTAVSNPVPSHRSQDVSAAVDVMTALAV